MNERDVVNRGFEFEDPLKKYSDLVRSQILHMLTEATVAKRVPLYKLFFQKSRVQRFALFSIWDQTWDQIRAGYSKHLNSSFDKSHFMPKSGDSDDVRQRI